MYLLVSFALIAAFAHSIYNIANKYLVTGNRLGALQAGFLVQILTGLLSLVIIVIASISWHSGANLAVFVTVVLMVGGTALMLVSLSLEDASAVAPILGLKVLFVAVLESLTQGHSVSLATWQGAGLSVVGVALISQRDRWSLYPRDILRPGIIMMGLTALCYAFADILTKHVLKVWQGDSLAITLYTFVFAAIVSFTALWLLPIMSIRHRRAVDAIDWRILRRLLLPISVAAVSYLLARFFLFRAFAIDYQVTLVNILFNARGLFVVLIMALLVLGRHSTVERATWRAYVFRTAGTVITLLAVILALWER